LGEGKKAKSACRRKMNLSGGGKEGRRIKNRRGGKEKKRGRETSFGQPEVSGIVGASMQQSGGGKEVAGASRSLFPRKGERSGFLRRFLSWA